MIRGGKEVVGGGIRRWEEDLNAVQLLGGGEMQNLRVIIVFVVVFSAVV